MNMFKKNGGFTLVELIVVIAILAILAGIAVPAYSGYLKSAEKAGDITALSAVKTASVAAMATTGEVNGIVVEAAEGKVTAVVVNPTIDETTNKVTAGTYLYYDAEQENADANIQVATTDFESFVDVTGIELGYFQTGAQWPVEDAWDVYPAVTEGE